RGHACGLLHFDPRSPQGAGAGYLEAVTGLGVGDDAVTARPRAEVAADPVARTADAALDAVVVVLATWTVVYHVCLLSGIGATPALVAEGVLLVGAAWMGRGSVRRTQSDGCPAPAARSVRVERSWTRGPTVWTLASAAIAATAMALRGPWVLVWVPWLVAGLTGSFAAVSCLRGLPSLSAGAPAPPSRGGAGFVLVAATGCAAFSLVAMRPNPDDLFYVNVSQWVAEHGTFPVRDTLFSDLRYPMANWPPTASYDALTGAVAHLLGTPAGTITYLVVPPLASFLAVLALWRLLRAWRTPLVSVAMAAALLFLLFDGTSSYGSPGNLFVTRLWQGKVILLCVLVPVLLVHALRFVERPSRARAGWLFGCGVAAVALSTTAIFLVPILAVAATAPLLVRSPRTAVAGFAALSAYPVGVGVVTLLTGGRSADDFGGRRLYRFDGSWIGHEVFLDGLIAFVAVAAVLLGCLVLPHPPARLTSALAVMFTGLVFVPGSTRLAYDLTGLGPTLWRVTWACTVAGLVGVLASWVVSRWGARWARRDWRRWLGLVAASLAVALLAAFGSPIWAGDTSTRLVRPFHWQRGDESRAIVAWMLAHSSPGDIVLAPDGLSVTVAVTTTRVKTVAPRDYYLDYLSDDPTFDYADRLTLDHLVNRVGGWSAGAVPPALSSLGVRIACVFRDDHVAAGLLRAAGFSPAHSTATYRCFLA
ncbi:MAG: hypothetical protein QOD98_4661, partial [Nocardioidaceae bacterium]|nr:hypothetical protein [Nocardioidaceae bacterium]